MGNSKVSKGGSSSNTASLPDQFARDKGFEKRAQYYAAKAYSSQAHKGDQDLKGVIFIAIADFILFPNKLAYKSDHVTFDKITYEHDLKDFSCTFIELPKFNKTKEDQLSNIVEKWIYFFSATLKVVVLWWLNSTFPRSCRHKKIVI